MICYKDRTYCSRECGNIDCSRNITDEVMRDATRWSETFGLYHLLINKMDLKTDTCGFIKKEKQMASVNKVILLGNLAKDPDTKYMSNGDAVTNVTIATSETWKDKNNQKQEKTEFHRVTFYRKLAEIAGEYLKKGKSVYVEGRLETRKYTDKNGVERYTTDIIASEMKMLGSKPQESEQKAQSNATGFEDFEDDIPW